jgi:Zn-dependent protease with chaperone function
MDLQSPSPSGDLPVRVERWPTEIPLLIAVALCAIAIWIVLAVSVIGLVYAVLLGLFFFFTHLTFVAHVRGSAVRLSAEQFPDLHRRVEELSARAGLRRAPETYLMQAGGVLNALATKFLRSRFIVLYSELLDACGEDQAARDMVVGHEIGHIRAGHLTGMWLLAPGFFVPFLGSACSRAREFTCDRYGWALCGDRRGGLTGLAILAAGGRRGPHVNVGALARQRSSLNTGFMTLGKWLGTHPPLCDRLAALEPELDGGTRPFPRGPLLASLGVLLVAGGWIAGTAYFAMKALPEARKAFGRAALRDGRSAGPPGRDPIVAAVDPKLAAKTIQKDFKDLEEVAEKFRTAMGKYPADAEALYGMWRSDRSGVDEPLDPFTNEYYFFEPDGDQFLLWSSGPDATSGTPDDIHFFGGTRVTDGVAPAGGKPASP